jgi:hypothetical protein
MRCCREAHSGEWAGSRLKKLVFPHPETEQDPSDHGALASCEVSQPA